VCLQGRLHPAADDDGHHEGRADGGGLPAGRRRVKPDERDDEGAAAEPGKLRRAQNGHQNAGNERDVQPADNR